ncbi:transcriptional regulator [Macrococcus epidermidis]|uniref:helix-turn-helix domain-containing protein n=1 Tax=Staphylococcaceae TaxID=90964 RepID=UPI001EF24BF4|nr:MULTISPECIES: helix-turn-helix transcriptional regulator [Macrococcus]MCG7419649.1 transcriptional regulator [Macrococcus epidermidis]
MKKNNDKESELKLKIGSFLKRIRNEYGITTTELSNLTGYSQSHISGMENGKKTFPSEKFIEGYLRGIVDSEKDLNNYLQLIENIKTGGTEEEYKEETSLFDAFEIKNSPFDMIEILNDGKTKAHRTMHVPINDISFVLNDFLNPKYFRKLPIDNHDRQYIEETIKLYLIQKYTLKVTDLEKYIEENPLTNPNDLIDTISKYKMIISDLEKSNPLKYKRM